MSRDIFTDYVASAQRKVHDGLAGGSLSRARDHGSSSNLFPRSPDTQKFVDAMDAEKDLQNTRKDAGTNTPENREKAIEAEMAERERKKFDFHVQRAIPRCVEEGWKHLREEMTDQAIRVYTIDNERRRFWGIKPAGIGMYDFWEQNDPEVRRYDDKVAMTWADPLVAPPFNTWEGNTPVVWAGQGVNPDALAPEPDIAQVPPPTKAAKSRRRQKTPEVNPINRVRKSKSSSPKINKKNTRKSLASKVDADQLPKEQNLAPATDGPSQNDTAITPPKHLHKPATKDKDPAPLKPTQSRPSRKATAAPADPSPQPPKRPRGRPAKPKPPPKDKATSSPKRPRGRPPGKGKSTAVQGNARVTKASSQQKGRRALAPSTHVMRTRGKGTAELLQL